MTRQARKPRRGNHDGPGFLPRLGAYGFDIAEPVILAALVTEDPMLLLGNSSTGKTFLLNPLPEELGLAHRHRNASLISFDDLMGYPHPEEDRSGVKFLGTPATVRGAEGRRFSHHKVRRRPRASSKPGSPPSNRDSFP
jgi:hypothetical protein